MIENTPTLANEQEIENLIQTKGKTAAPRITPQDLDDELHPHIAPQYHIFPGTSVTVCCLSTKSGFCVVGVSAPVSSDNFDPEIGREVARKHARDKLWPLMGFRLASQLYQLPPVRAEVAAFTDEGPAIGPKPPTYRLVADIENRVRLLEDSLFMGNAADYEDDLAQQLTGIGDDLADMAERIEPKMKNPPA